MDLNLNLCSHHESCQLSHGTLMNVELGRKTCACLIKINYENVHSTDTKHHLENSRFETLMSYQLTKLMNLKEVVWHRKNGSRMKFSPCQEEMNEHERENSVFCSL